ncbi:gamma-aminobutyric acid receptor subunit alpha-6-like [Acropora palmata]|uniref:gamma-aminobutyric acid receptor subunit alpha-6-like n=1 Tax=Acropora palmata TaxID=6131 RepID=UPI003D9FD00C
MKLLFVLFAVTVRGADTEGADIITKLFSGYDRAVRPGSEKGKETTVKADLYVESFGNIEEANMDYKIYTYFYQRWKDERLAGKLNHTLIIKGGDINMWLPDPYCYNARESNMMTPDEELHSSVSIQPSGDIIYSKGVILLASCHLDLRSFPHDSQHCHLKFGSYSYTTNDIIFEWSATDVNVGTKEMAQFEYEGVKLSSATDVFSTGSFSTITVTFLFKRRIGYFLIQVYFPDIFVVMLSWIVFWMEIEDIGNRMSLGITCILTIMFLLGSLNGNLPKVSYPKALDWYLLMSFAFVFVALMEAVVVYVLNFSATKDKEKIKCKVNATSLPSKISQTIKTVIATKRNPQLSVQQQGNGQTNRAADDDLEMVNRKIASKMVVDDGPIDEFIGTSKKEAIAEFIDKASRLIFPLLFIVFNLVYWIYFTFAGN